MIESTASLCFFLGAVTLAALRLTVRYAHVPDLIVVTAPALRNFRPAIPDCFFARRVTLTISFSTNVEGGFNDLSVDAAPALIAAMSERFFS